MAICLMLLNLQLTLSHLMKLPKALVFLFPELDSAGMKPIISTQNQQMPLGKKEAAS